jgi:hypothetical protein
MESPRSASGHQGRKQLALRMNTQMRIGIMTIEEQLTNIVGY